MCLMLTKIEFYIIEDVIILLIKNYEFQGEGEERLTIFKELLPAVI